MKHLSVLVAFLIIALVNAAGALAYFHLDEKFIGKPTVTKLADSRIHIKFEEKKNEPFPKDAKLPESRSTGGLSLALADTLKNQENYFSFRGEAIMKSHWESFQLEDNTDADKTVCHDNGDKNMRMSIYGASSQLVDALKNKKESVILHADANQHICHGNPIFRVVTAAHFFGDEILLVTDVAHYQNLFDEADIALDIKHPDLTHIRSDREIVHPIANDHSAPITSSKSTFGASAVDETEDRFNDKHQENLGENSKTSSTSSSKRVAKAQHFGFHHLVHHISHAVHHVAHSVSHAVSKVTKAVAKGAKKVVNEANKIVGKIGNVVWTLAEILQLNFDKNLNPHVTVNKNAAKTLVGVDFTMDLHFTAGFKFQLNIHHGELIIFYTSVYGDLNFGAAAEIPHFDKPSSGQSTLWNIPGGSCQFRLHEDERKKSSVAAKLHDMQSGGSEFEARALEMECSPGFCGEVCFSSGNLKHQCASMNIRNRRSTKSLSPHFTFVYNEVSPLVKKMVEEQTELEESIRDHLAEVYGGVDFPSMRWHAIVAWMKQRGEEEGDIRIEKEHFVFNQDENETRFEIPWNADVVEEQINRAANGDWTKKVFVYRDLKRDSSIWKSKIEKDFSGVFGKPIFRVDWRKGGVPPTTAAATPQTEKKSSANANNDDDDNLLPATVPRVSEKQRLTLAGTQKTSGQRRGRSTSNTKK